MSKTRSQRGIGPFLETFRMQANNLFAGGVVKVKQEQNDHKASAFLQNGGAGAALMMTLDPHRDVVQIHIETPVDTALKFGDFYNSMEQASQKQNGGIAMTPSGLEIPRDNPHALHTVLSGLQNNLA